MKSVRILSKNIPKALHPWLKNKSLIYSAYIPNILNLSTSEAEVLLIHDNDNVFIAEEYNDFFHVHGIFQDVHSVRTCFETLGKKCYLWSTIDLKTDEGHVTKFILKRKNPYQDGKAPFCLPANPEDIIESILQKEPSLMNLAYQDLIKKSFSEKKYYAELSEEGEIQYLQSYLLRDRTYSGIYIYSEKNPGITVSNFLKIHDLIDVDSYETWITSWNEASLALHTLVGYQKTDQRFYLVKN